MKNTERLLENERYKNYLKRLEAFESDRVFCRHNLEHFVSVARIAYIHALENCLINEEDVLCHDAEKADCSESYKKNYGCLISKDLIYFTSLLHDIGRLFEYEEGTPHDEASVEIAISFLDESTFNRAQEKLILDCIKEHRGRTEINTDSSGDSVQELLIKIFKRSDKESRMCFTCKAYDDCYWSEEKKNHTVKY